ncbi:MAG: DNA-processing protein DprA [Steroidobacteraceae bacterium]
MPVFEDTSAWVQIARTPALDAATLARAIERLHSPGKLIGAGDAELAEAGVGGTAREHLCAHHAATVAELRWLEHATHHLVPCTAADYPGMLRSCATRPLALYVAGRLDALKDPPLAVVGSRRPTPGGLDNAFEFSRILAERGLVIASGLASGIDAAAHRGALAAQGLTLAVLGTGVDRVYPETNRDLCEAIRYGGALMSPFPLGTPPRPANFPRRNQLIAALSLGTLVVEAARGSGSLITARATQRLGRPVLAIPGSIHNPMSRGCHRLIKEGAHLAESADDILSRLDFSGFFAHPPRVASAPQTEGSSLAGMDKEHKILLDALGFDPADLDTLIVRTGLKPEAVSSMMLILELEGHVQAAPGGRYSRVANRRAGGER